MKEETKDKVYQIIFWTSLGVIAFWIIMKLLGIWESPVWQEVLPYAGGLFGAGAFYQMFMDMRKQLSWLTKDFSEMKIRFTKVETKIEHMDKDIGFLRNDIEALRA